MQRVASFLNKMNPFDNLFPDNRVDYLNPDGSTQKVNPDFLKLIMNRPDLRERFDRTGSIYSEPCHEDGCCRLLSKFSC